VHIALGMDAYVYSTNVDGGASLVYGKNEEQLTDILTKPLSVSKLDFHKDKLGVFKVLKQGGVLKSCLSSTCSFFK